MATNRQVLIQQLRQALGELERPNLLSKYYGDCVEFEIGDTSFCFEHEYLQASCNTDDD